MWRRWWITKCKTIDLYRSVSLNFPKVLIAEKTSEVREVAEALTDLTWTKLVKACDKHLAVPTVKCPWGCSQFVNLATESVPLDVVYVHGLEWTTCTVQIATLSKRACMHGTRPNFLWTESKILYNPDPSWRCMPTIVYKENLGPVFATCGKHSTKTKGLYIHPMRNPFGPIMSDTSDQYAPVVLHPRTVCSAKRREYSDSFHMVKMFGGYEGVDSMTLGNQGRYDKSDCISVRHDALALSCRSDLMAHIVHLGEEGSIPRDMINSKCQDTAILFPSENQLVTLQSVYQRDATYVPLEDALAIEKMQKQTSAARVTVMIQNDNPNAQEETREIHYIPSWPSYLLHVCPMIDLHGASFQVIGHLTPNHGNARMDLRPLWMTLCIIVHNPSIWKHVAASVQSDKQWQGWVLTFATKKYLPYVRKSGSRNNPFRRCLTIDKLYQKLQHATGLSTDYKASCILDIFGNIPCISVLSVVSVQLYGLSVQTEDSVILYSNILDNTGNPVVPITPTLTCNASGDKWMLKYVVVLDAGRRDHHRHTANNLRYESYIYATHGLHGESSKWWRHQQTTSKRTEFEKLSNLPNNGVFELWDICVYEKINKEEVCSLKEQYLLLAGGQNIFCCNNHNLCLITSTPAKSSRTCSFDLCNDGAYLECPYRNCNIGLCKEHWEKQSGLSSEGTLFPKIYIDDNMPDPTRRNEVPVSLLNELSALRISDSNIDVVDSEEDSEDDDYAPNGGQNSSTSSDESFSKCDNIMHLSSLHDSNELENDTVRLEDVMLVHNSVDSYLESDQEKRSLKGNEALQRMHVANLSDIYVQGFEEIDDDIYGDMSRFNENGSDASSSDSDHDHLDSDHLTTQFEASPTNYEFDSDFIGAHILFNKHASLLVRKQHGFVPSRQQRHFFQKIISTATTKSVPLLYPEAEIFPSIFWGDVYDGSKIGAIPCALLSDDATLISMGIAPLYEQLRTRVMNTDLLCSSDYRYQFFVLDALVNLGTRGQDTRVILSRGFGGTNEKQSGIRMIPESERVMFQSESLDCRPVVNKLAAALGEDMGSIFYTHTLSMKTHFVMRIIKAWVDSPQAIQNVALALGAKTISPQDEEDIHKFLVQSSCSIAVRSWSNVTNIWMHYICSSPEHPVGDVYRSFIRQEPQEVKANLFHLHCILWCREDDGTMEGTMKIVEKIRASMNTMVTDEEFQSYLNEGIVSSYNDLMRLLDDLSKMLQHKHHKRCLVPRKDNRAMGKMVSAAGDEDITKKLNTYYCKVPDNHLLSPNPSNHCFIWIDVHHTEAAVDALESLGLVQRVDSSFTNFSSETKLFGSGFFYVDKSLEAKRYIPPTSAEDGILSPVIARLVIINPNSDNAQYLDSYGVSKYLAKYVTDIDETARIYLKPPSAARPNTYTVDVEEVGNTKITGVAIMEDKKSKQKKKKSVGRAIAQPEGLTMIFDIPAVITNIDFVHISSVPLEERPALDRVPPIVRLKREKVVPANATGNAQDLDEKRVIPCIAAKHAMKLLDRLSDWRQHKDTDIMLAKDQILSPFTLDSVTIFGMRPPELAFIDMQSLYFKWFKRSPIRPEKTPGQNEGLCNLMIQYCRNALHLQYDRCAWIDCTSHQVYLRAAAIDPLILYLSSDELPLTHFAGNTTQKNLVLSFFKRIKRCLECSTTIGLRNAQLQWWLPVKEKFICCDADTELPVIWYTNIKPVHTNRFLIHVLLSMGHFRNELELLQCGSLRRAFIHARLHNPQEPDASLKCLVRSYVTSQLQHMPGGTRQFDRMLVASYVGLRGLLIDNTIVSEGIPPCLYTTLRENSTQKVEQIIIDKQRALIATLLGNLQSRTFPNLQQTSRHLLVWSFSAFELTCKH